MKHLTVELKVGVPQDGVCKIEGEIYKTECTEAALKRDDIIRSHHSS